MTFDRAMAPALRWQVGIPLFWITLAAGMLILIARLPESVFRPEFWAEDGLFYSEALRRGAITVIEPYEGYLFLVPRTVTLVATLLPPPMAPLLSNATQLLAISATAAFGTSSGLPWSRITGLLVALGIVLLPASLEVVGSISHFMWPATLWAALVAIKRDPTDRRIRILETAGLAIAGLSSLASLLLWPLFLVGPRRRLATVTATGIVQLALILASERVTRAQVDFAELPFVVLLRVFVTPVLGPMVASVLPMALAILVGLAIAAGITTLLLQSPRHLRVWCVTVLTTAPAAALLLAGFETATFGYPTASPRYFWLAGAALVVTLAVNRHRAVAIPIIAALVIGITLQFRLPAVTSMGWADASRCIRGPTACDVRVAPDDRFTVRWRP